MYSVVNQTQTDIEELKKATTNISQELERQAKNLRIWVVSLQAMHIRRQFDQSLWTFERAISAYGRAVDLYHLQHIQLERGMWMEVMPEPYLKEVLEHLTTKRHSVMPLLWYYKNATVELIFTI